MTTHAEETIEQQRWRARARAGDTAAFDALVEAEFLPGDAQRRRQERRLASVVCFAAGQVPYYRRQFERLGLAPQDVATIEDLPRLPVLGRWDLLEHEAALHARSLPEGERLFGLFTSSGTTGRPTRVLMTEQANLMFTLLSQRHYRWFRFEPAGKLAALIAPGTIADTTARRQLEAGATLRNPSWRYVGRCYRTGESVVLSRAQPIERQLAWLVEERPDYLVSYPGNLEELAFVAADTPAGWRPHGLLAISAQLTDGMRRRIEQRFGVPVQQSYGLNEIGLVAGRCDAGRYHVHAEHCIVEIVDEHGRPCQPGKTGRIVVTGLDNAAMPLLRYDTDDTAVAVAGPCACGRTLPAFADPSGRYRRWLGLPEGSRARFRLLTDALQAMPDAWLGNLRRYQVHQCRDGAYELRIVTAGPMPEAFARTVESAWARQCDVRQTPLRIVPVDRIDAGPGGKIQEFTSALDDADRAGPRGPQ
jgi:phenylacetate-CoA ligase